MKKHLLAWSKEPIVVPRWMLTVKYLAFAILGALSIYGGIPSLSQATFDTFTVYWGAALVLASASAAVASFRREWEEWEKWTSLILFALLSSWSVAAIWRAASEGDITRVAGSFAVLIISMLPGTRALGLMRVAGVK